MKKGKKILLLAIISIVCFSFSIVDVSAEVFISDSNTLSDLGYETIGRINFMDCTAANTCETDLGSMSNSDSMGYFNINNTTFGTNGIDIVLGSSEYLMSGRTYSISLLIASNKSLSLTSYPNERVGSISNNVSGRYDTTYYGSNWRRLSQVYISSGGNSFEYVYSIYYILGAKYNGSVIRLPLSTTNNASIPSGSFLVSGYSVNDLGPSTELTTDDITNALDNEFKVLENKITEAETSINSNINSSTNSINENIDEMTEEQEVTNEKLDEIINTDIDDKYKEKPNDDKYNDYSSAEGALTEKVKQADLSNISIGIDNKSSSWVWDTLTSLLQSHSVVFGLFIGILSIGIIKLALGR